MYATVRRILDMGFDVICTSGYESMVLRVFERAPLQRAPKGHGDVPVPNKGAALPAPDA